MKASLRRLTSRPGVTRVDSESTDEEAAAAGAGVIAASISDVEQEKAEKVKNKQRKQESRLDLDLPFSHVDRLYVALTMRHSHRQLSRVCVSCRQSLETNTKYDVSPREEKNKRVMR